MKVKTTLQKIMNKEFFPTLRKVMEKWSEAKDIHAFVKIAEKIEEESRTYLKAQEVWCKANGFQLPNGERSVNPEEITDHLLQEHGRFDASSKLSMAGTSEDEKEAFLEKKLQADAVLKKYKEEFTALLEKEFELEIPRQVKVLDKFIRKEIISAHDCFVLLPILDLDGVSDLAETEKESEEV